MFNKTVIGRLMYNESVRRILSDQVSYQVQSLFYSSGNRIMTGTADAYISATMDGYGVRTFSSEAEIFGPVSMSVTAVRGSLMVDVNFNVSLTMNPPDVRRGRNSGAEFTLSALVMFMGEIRRWVREKEMPTSWVDEAPVESDWTLVSEQNTIWKEADHGNTANDDSKWIPVRREVLL